MPGPPPTPTKLKRLRGNPGQRRLNDREPEPTPTTTDPPTDLSPAELALWQAHAPELVRLGLLTVVDRAELALYCRLRAFGLAHLESAKKGDFSLGLQALIQSSHLARYFGIGGPASRTRLVAPVTAPPSKWAGLITKSA